jgi:signal transduction histidine kinase
VRFLTSVYSVYTLLLLYTIAALLFWGFSLNRQSQVIYDVQRDNLQHQIDSVKDAALYHSLLADLDNQREKRSKQYLGEGGTLMCILLIGGAVVYTSLRRNASLQRQQNNFMLAVTHELKSPIAGMKLSIQTLQRHQLSEEQRSQLLGRCIQEADRLSELCNNMLVTSQIEGRQYKIASEELSLSELVNDSVFIYAARYPGRISGDVAEDCNIVGDMLLLQMAINNLLENAIKYTPADSPITIQLHKNNRDVILQIADNGSGIPDSEKKKVFSKFYRIGDEATRRTKGTGLGLYLTKRIVRQHKGRISITDNQPHGAIFQISLPCS